MSYSQHEHALDTVLEFATVDIDSMDPDEREAFAEFFIVQCRVIRDGYDENGYPKED